MPPHSTNMYDSESSENLRIKRDLNAAEFVEQKPTNLVEVVNHFPKDIFEKRPFRAYMGALQVSIVIETFLHWIKI